MIHLPRYRPEVPGHAEIFLRDTQELFSTNVTRTRITVVRGGLPLPAAEPGELVVPDDDVRAWVLNGSVLRRTGRFDDARLQTERLSTSGRPMLAWALRLMARDRCYIADAQGLERDVTVGLLLRWSWQVVRESMGKSALLRRVGRVDDTGRTARARLTPSGTVRRRLYCGRT